MPLKINNSVSDSPDRIEQRNYGSSTNILFTSPSPSSRNDVHHPPGKISLVPRLGGVSTSFPPDSNLCLGKLSRVRNLTPSGRTAQHLPWLRGSATARLNAFRCPARPSPSALTAPSRCPLTGGGRSTAPTQRAAPQLGTTDLQSESWALSTVLCSKTANLPAPTLSSLPQPPLPPPPAASTLAPSLPQLEQGGCRSSSYFLPTPRPTSAAGSGPVPKPFPLEPTYFTKRFRPG